MAGTAILTPAGPKPIESIRVGDRVISSDRGETAGKDSEEDLSGPILPERWRKLTLRLPDPDGPGEAIRVVALRPAAWVARHGATVGGLLSALKGRKISARGNRPGKPTPPPQQDGPVWAEEFD